MKFLPIQNIDPSLRWLHSGDIQSDEKSQGEKSKLALISVSFSIRWIYGGCYNSMVLRQAPHNLDFH